MLTRPSRRKKEIPTKLEYQDYDVYCGAACAEMVLEDLKVKNLDQKSLFIASNSFHTIDPHTSWNSSPDGLVYTLNHNKPKTFKSKFNLYANKKQNVILARMLWVMWKYNVPCIVVVRGGEHWIVIYGFDPLGENPKNVNDINCKINGLYINNPWRSIRTQGYIKYDYWLKHYSSTVFSGHWHDKYLAICDPPKGKKKRSLVEAYMLQKPFQQKATEKKVPVKNNLYLANTNIPLKPEKFNQNKASKNTIKINPVNGQNIINEKTAAKYALRALKNDGFYIPSKMSLILSKPTPDKPVLVQYIGEDYFYYLVPIKDSNKKVYGVMSMAAIDGRFLEATFAMKYKEPIVFKPLARGEILRVLKAGNYINEQDLKKLKIYRSLVWKYCRQSLSTCLPFHMITIDRRKVYVRIDKIIFAELTTSTKC